MSFTSSTSSNQNCLNDNLIDKILEKGEKLRNAMVKSILEQDPFNDDILNCVNKNKDNDKKSSININDYDKNKLETFLKGDKMNRKEELEALDTLRSMSSNDLCKTTNQIYTSKKINSNCSCTTCCKYAKEDLNCDLKRSSIKRRLDNIDTNGVSAVILQKNRVESNEFFKYVDCMRVIIHELVLNDRGNRKVTSCLNSINKVPLLGSQTFFIEYELPFILSVTTRKKNLKKSTGNVKNNNFMRVCARRLSREAVSFKQTSMHNIKNVDQINLDGLEMKFQISCRTMRQKNVTQLGFATFNFNNFEQSPSLSCTEELLINFNDNVPIVLGKLNVTLEMGCDKLYFGKDFIASIKGNSTDDLNVNELNKTFTESSPIKKKTIKSVEKKSVTSIKEEEISEKSPKVRIQKTSYLETVRVNEKRILFGFLYIPEAEYLRANINSFIKCRAFCQEDSSFSKLILNDSNPIFNFTQLVPLVYEDNLLKYLRENVMVIEFWEKFETKDILFGITKLSLHQYYISYRNPDVTRYLIKNKLPVITSDWWEEITNPYTDETVGQVQVLLSLGTEEQINNLEIERGFKENIVKAKYPLNTKKEPPKKIERKVTTPLKKKLDKGVQSDIKMNQENQQQQEKLDELLNQIKSMGTQRPTLVETGTNTDEKLNETKKHDDLTPVDTSDSLLKYENAPPIVRSTSDLLNKLQIALSIPPKKQEDNIRTSFKVQIEINQALHLPVRKKCKSKKSKNKEDNIKPSTYVTFETMPGIDLKITQLIPKSTSPNWKYKTDVLLPSELLLNNQKRMIFKVWKKSTNTNMIPNLQTDMIIGFVAIDLTILLSGFPNIQGWYNITDFSSKTNGQINIHITPLEDLTIFKTYKEIYVPSVSPSLNEEKITPQEHINQEEDGELLSRALKRKFTELDEITQRLRLRLSHVTNDDDSDGNDEIANEFENDINTLSIEDDFDMVNFENGIENIQDTTDLLTLQTCSNSSTSTISIVTQQEEINKEFDNTEETLNILDRQLLEGKQRIDTLLGKLSLISSDNNSFSSRYISGCSTTNRDIDTEAILKDLDLHSRPNIHASTSFDTNMFAKIYGNDHEKDDNSSSTSVISNLGELRAAPDGQGTFHDDKNKVNE